MILLDTHILIWAFEDDRRLSRSARRVIDEATWSTGIAFSVMTVWEIVMLTERGRLALSRDVSEWIDFMAASPGMRQLPFEPAIAIGSNRLPGTFHADPADRILLATARHFALPFLTADRKIVAYGRDGHANIIDAGE